MEQFLTDVFLKILNMSLTASYVIAAVLLVRLLLKRAPKKYSYALWLAAAFRLVCPVSFQSVFSLFTLKPFALNVSDTSSSAATAIVHIPENIGLMAQPEIATGIASVNAVVNPMLPAPTTELTSVNPLQVWIFIGMVLWCLGITVLVAFSLVNLIRLRMHLRGAVRLEGNVWQSESVHSPFILGIVRPKIYIPYGLRSDELGYVLRHERSHIRRGDHIIKILAFAILCLHWFNPLVWLAYHLMGKDMELSCDEKVLSETPDISADYSTTLLSFASNRRFPAPTPLAFGETGVKGRIKNALRWHKPRVWVSITALVLCIAVVAACAANPREDKEPEGVMEMLGTYVPYECVYMSPLSSFYPFAGDNGYIYRMDEEGFTVIDHESGEVSQQYDVDWSWQSFPYIDEEWAEMLGQPEDVYYPPISQQYDAILYQPLSSGDFLLNLDGELWLVHSGQHPDGTEYIWSIYSLVPEEQMGSAPANYHPAVSALWGIGINFDIPGLTEVNVYCDRGMIAASSNDGPIQFIDVSGTVPAGGHLLWNPMNTGEGEALMVSTAKIQFTAMTETQSISGNIYVTVERNDHSWLCTFTVVGTGLHMEQDEEGRISITADPAAMSGTPRVEDVDAGSPWNWTSTLTEADISPGYMLDGNIDTGKSGELNFFSRLIDALNFVQPDEIVTGRGMPSLMDVTLCTAEGDCTLRYGGGDIVELSFKGELAERYPNEEGIWEIHNEALCELLKSVMVEE